MRSEGHQVFVLTVIYAWGTIRQYSVRPERVAEVRRWPNNYQELIPLHDHQRGRFFHGYYDNYCFCRSMCFAAGSFCWPSCAVRTSTPAPGPSRKSPGS